MWQDLALMIVGFVFTIMLIPQLNDARNGKAIMNFWTCLITGLGCITIGGIDITLNLPMAAVVSVTTGLMWLGLMYYSGRNRKRPTLYVNPGAKNLSVRDQGNRGTSVGIAMAYAMELKK
jgi:hypothetical protein